MSTRAMYPETPRSRSRRLWLVGIVAGLLTVAFGSGSAAAGDVHTITDPAVIFAQSTGDGQALYVANCGSCHGPDGSGQPGVTPPLRGNPAAADAAYVEDVIRNGIDGPLEVLGVQYDSIMFPIPIEDDEIALVVAYVQTLADIGAGPTDPEPATPREPDPSHGQALFNGSAAFSEGGPACRSCHTAGSTSFWGGQTLGPDLTDIADVLGGEAGVRGFIASPPAPTMRPLYVDNALTDDEAADVAAYLASLEGQTPAGGVDQLLIAGVIGLLILLGFMARFVRGPQMTYAERLRSRT